MIGIYKITSPSGKVYIGQSWNIEKRFKDYSRLLNCKEQRRVYNSFLKHSIKNHKFEICHELPIDVEQEVLDRYEQFYMDRYRECGIELLNLKSGGMGGKHCQETKDIISRKNKGKRGHNLGKPMSEETKMLLRLSRLGTKASEETKIKLRNKKISDQTKLRIKKALTGKPKTGRAKLHLIEISKKGSSSLRKPIVQLLNNIKISEYVSTNEASRLTKIASRAITNALTGRTKSSGGFVWKYKIKA